VFSSFWHSSLNGVCKTHPHIEETLGVYLYLIEQLYGYANVIWNKRKRVIADKISQFVIIL